MRMNRRILVGAAAAAAFAPRGAFAQGRTAPTPYGATPSARQLAWHELEIYGFIHFCPNTFTDREWGYGDEAPSIFNPTDFSAEQIVSASKSGGLRGLILTAKHHDGFCLWPSRYTDHSVKNCPYRGGRGDIVGEIAAACAAQGLKFGVYLSPWDRHHAEYGRPAYVEYFHSQLEELTTQYGPLFEVWFDGANGGDGYYGGAREQRRIDAATYYQWDKVREIVRRNQPGAVTFADAYMDVRWVGNEAGIAGDPCWPTVDDTPYTTEKGNRGVRGGPIWNPAETNTSIRPGWFWHEDENERVRSPANLMNLYMTSVARGTTLLLNLPPDRRGRIHEADAASIARFRELLDEAYANDLAEGARVRASSTFSREFSPSNVARPGGYWAARESDREGAWLALQLPEPRNFNFVRLREEISLGVRIDEYVVEIEDAGAWREIARCVSMGLQRIIRLEAPVTATHVRVRIVSAASSPAISEFSLYRLPDIIEEPSIRRGEDGSVVISAHDANAQILYGLDGAAPTLAYSAPIPLLEGGVVRAKAKRGALESDVATNAFDIAPVGWQIVSANGDHPETLLTPRGNWWEPFFVGHAGSVEIVIDMAQSRTLTGFTLQPAGQNPHDAGPPAAYMAWLSEDGVRWGAPAGAGEFSNIAANRGEQRIRFSAPGTGRFLKLALPRAVGGRSRIALDGIGFLTR
jgi:alpha-L-fucosidase